MSQKPLFGSKARKARSQLFETREAPYQPPTLSDEQRLHLIRAELAERNAKMLYMRFHGRYGGTLAEHVQWNRLDYAPVPWKAEEGEGVIYIYKQGELVDTIDWPAWYRPAARQKVA